MAEVPAVRKNIQLPEVEFRAAVSESTAQKIGGSINFINNNQYDTKAWFLNGKTYNLTTPFTAIDGCFMAAKNIEIFNVFMLIRQAGGAGTTEFDIEYATTPGGSWTSIFSVTPKINFTAGNFSWVYVGSAFANTTAPVLAVTNFNQYTVFRANVVTSQTLDARGTSIEIFYKPR